MSSFENIKKNFGFGCMRLPMNGNSVNYEEFTEMIDEFMTAGFNYFDTARVYLSGQSETALRDCLVKRYPRESFVLTNKLSDSLFNSEEEIRPLFQKQLKSCGVDYFDFYLMHAQNRNIFEKYKKCHAYEHAFELKKEGKIRHVGLSFHDTAQVLDKILTEYPEIEAVQIQFNYLDYDDPAIQARMCYEICRKHGKPIIVMEPVKGGSLVNLPDNAKQILDGLNGGSPASYAIRYAAGFDGIFMVLSGMSNIPQMQDNLSYMQDFKPLDSREKEAINKVRDIFNGMFLIKCTSCRYCTDGCPRHIEIPLYFSCMNSAKLRRSWNAKYYYDDLYAKSGVRASDCIGCGKCELSCPQKLPIRQLLKDVAAEFENK